MEKKNIYVGDQKFSVLVVTTEEEKESGLQGVKSLDKNEGMLFDYTMDPPTELSFWMKDTEIPLDIIFINNILEVVGIEQGEPLSEDLITCTTNDNETIYYVLEVNQSSGIKVGEKVSFEEEEDEDDLEDVSDEDLKMYLLGPDGKPIHAIEPGCRIFSRIHTRELIRLAKTAQKRKTDQAYKKLGKKVFNILDIHSTQEDQYVEAPK